MNKILKPCDAYGFCVRCGSKVKIKTKTLLVCTVCNHNHYINPTPTNGVIIENNRGEILLVRRGIEPKKGLWDTPGGFIESNESILRSVQREIKEELNLSIKPDTLKIVGIYPDTYNYQCIKESTLTIIVSAEANPGKITPQDDVSEYKFVPKKEVLSMPIAFSAVKRGLKDYLRSSNL